jgi:hypothetical protein
MVTTGFIAWSVRKSKSCEPWWSTITIHEFQLHPRKLMLLLVLNVYPGFYVPPQKLLIILSPFIVNEIPLDYRIL